MATSWRSRLGAFARSFAIAAWLPDPASSDAAAHFYEDASPPPEKGSGLQPTKYDGHDTAFRGDSW
ncbi:MAG: hypothetical protein ACAH80_07215 [Alphaproteobacteria bacterium]